MSDKDLLEPPEFASWMHEMSLPGMQVNSSPTEMMQVPSALWMLLRDDDDGIDALIHHHCGDHEFWEVGDCLYCQTENH